MPRYKKKITRQMSYEKFAEAIAELPIMRQAFLSILFFAGVRVSEALALTLEDVTCSGNTIYIEFFRLKGSKQTDPVPLPRNSALYWLCDKGTVLTRDQRIFPFSRTTAYRLVRKTFGLYPHYFRMNRITWISENFGDAQVYSFTGICAQSIDHYRGKVDIKKVGKALLKETKGV